MFNNKKIIIPIAVLCFVIILAIAYAAFTSNLNITGTGNVRDSKWKVYFSRLSEATTTGTATVSMPTLTQNATSIGDYIATVMSPGDSISFEVDVTNDGDYDALLSNVTINATPTCKYNNDATDTSAQNVCNNLTYSIKYQGGASLIANTDILHSKETQTLVVELKYANITNSNLLPTHDIDITGLGISLTYVQSGNAKVNTDGTTPYDPYPIGGQITVANEQYYVVSSNPSDDYVIALKVNPLTADEVISAGGETSDTGSNLGRMNYYNSVTCNQSDKSDCKNLYSLSPIKEVIDGWAASKFTHSELKTVDGYAARLINRNEIETNEEIVCLPGEPCETQYRLKNNFFALDNYDYWTMSQYNDSNHMVWFVDRYGFVRGADVYGYYGQALNVVRPVINVYKSAIQNNS